MLTLFDYRPSRNAWKVRQLLAHLGLPYRVEPVAIFAGEGRRPEYLRVNPTGTVPAIRLGDGRVLAESNAILLYLAEQTPYLPGDAFDRARVAQWLAFEQERIESTIGSLRYWNLTGKLDRRAPVLVQMKRAAATRALDILDAELATREWIAGDAYTIADIAIHAYAGVADEAGFEPARWPRFAAWCARVRAQPGFDPSVDPYSVDPDATRELP